MADKFISELFDILLNEIKEIKESQKETREDVGHMKEDLNIHIYRTELLEKSLEQHVKENKEEIEPLKRDSNRIKGGLALISGLALILTILSFLKII